MMRGALVGVAIALGTAPVTGQSQGWSIDPVRVTVGDTVRLERVVAAESPEVTVRPAPLEMSNDVEPLRNPEVTYEGAGVRIRYVVAPFRVGEISITMPEIELIAPNGDVTTLRGGTAVVRVETVLPEADSLPPPRWSKAPLGRASSRIEPALLMTLAVAALVVVWGMTRRRVRTRPAWDDDPPRESHPPYARWVSFGEPRAVAALKMSQVRRRIAELVPEANQSLSVEECLEVVTRERPEWPNTHLRETMRSLARASFAPAVPSDVLIVVDEMDELLDSLEREPAST